MTRRGRGWLPTLAAAALPFAVGLAPSAARADASDLWTMLQVKLDLIRQQGLGALDLDVDTDEGLVTLHGTAPSDVARAESESIARGIGGTRPVRNLIQVAPVAGHEPTSRDDAEIRREIAQRLRADPELSDVAVASLNRGVVVLEGRTGSLAAHLRAVEIAERVRGVRHVASEVRSVDRAADFEIWRDSLVPVEPPAEPLRDLWVTSAAKLRLLSNGLGGFDVSTRAGSVTLFGIVGSTAERARAEELAGRVGSARSVRNELQVVSPDDRAAVERSDAKLAPRVEQRLAAEHRLAAEDIDIDVSNGVVRLEGEVAERSERLHAIALARATRGVRAVVPEIEVETW